VEENSPGVFTYLSREDDIIKASGMRISPTEIEDLVLHRFKDSIQEICVVGMEDEVRGTVIYCAIVPRKTPEELSEKEIREYVREHLGVHFTPKRVTLFQEPFPRTESGKVKRKEVAKLF
jgi:acetyl-CoA synthetase